LEGDVGDAWGTRDVVLRAEVDDGERREELVARVATELGECFAMELATPGKCARRYASM
jgi:hypothetical protein